MLPADAMNEAELAALLLFHADAGMEWLIEEAPVDRFAEFVEQQSRARSAAPAASAAPAQERRRETAQTPKRMEPVAALPDEEVVARAVAAAAEATTIEALDAAVKAFTGCNLRNSARNTAFLDGQTTAPVLVAGGLPGPDDDRDGRVFSGPAGQMLERMLGAIGISMAEVCLINVIPWRPPGNRPPTAKELEICLPFSLRLIELGRPARILALGAYPARVLTGSTDGIHAMRGKWFDVRAGVVESRLLATFHPLELQAAPLNKRLAWQDLLVFSGAIANPASQR